jgi:GxxExxY protein
MAPSRRPKGDESTRSIIGGFYAVYTELGYGLVEPLYSKALEIELRLRGHVVEREKWFDVYYKGHRLGRQRIDMIVDHTVVVENKATSGFHFTSSGNYKPIFASADLSWVSFFTLDHSPSFIARFVSNVA